MGGADRVVRFGRYTLHPTQGLVRGAREIRVTQKALSVLRVLANRPGELVTKDEIFHAVWPGTAVSDAALTSCIQELRRALKDDARAPRFIETLHRRGFRFLPATADAGAVPSGQPSTAAAPVATLCVGRRDSLDLLSVSFARAESGSRQLVVVQGEPGIGKTTLVDAFLEGLPGEPSTLVSKSACVEGYGEAEPYGPLLDAVMRLCRPTDGERHTALLRRCAPTWLAQLPALQTPSDVRTLHRRTAGVTRERMSRELTEFFEAVGSERTLVVWIDDLHWADVSTLDWLASFTARSDPARVLMVVTIRGERGTRAHSLCMGLRLKPWCHLIALTGLDLAATRDLVQQRSRGDAQDAGTLASRLHAMTEGHPLFITALLDASPSESPLAERGRHDGDREDLSVPQGLRELIDAQIGRLGAGEPELLEVASLVMDADWPAALVAAGTEQALADVEQRLMRLAARDVFIRHAGTTAWPDGTATELFSFKHAIHRDVLRARLPAARRAQTHQRIGARLEQAFGPEAPRLAVALALHFEQSGDVDRAVRYLAEAARAANRIGASEEGRRHVTRALALLRTLPPSAARDEREIELQMLLGTTLMAESGWGAPQVEQAYQRASELCERLESAPQRFPAYWGLWLFRWGRGELAPALALTDTLADLANRSDARLLHLQVLHAKWATEFCLGRFDEALASAELGGELSRDGISGQATLPYGNHHAGVCARSFAARALAAIGRSGEARRAADQAVAEARRFDHPFSLALALVFAAATYQTVHEPDAVSAHAREAAELSEGHGFELMLAWARALDGWAASVSGHFERTVNAVGEAVAAALGTGSGQFRTLFLALLADAQRQAGQRETGLSTLDDALAWVRGVGERFHEAELHRLRGDLLAIDSSPAAITPATAAYEQAFATAREQRAHLFALRAAIALARHQRRHGIRGDSRALVEGALRQVADPPPTDRQAASTALASAS